MGIDVSTITADQLAGDPHPIHAALRQEQPVAWIPALHGWLVTARDLVIRVMRDPERFTVDHPGFTTAQIIGPSMLSLDGPEHRRHRDPFAGAFRLKELRERFTAYLADQAQSRVSELRPLGTAELRTALCAPFAVDVVAELLGILGVDPQELLAIYRDIVDAVTQLSRGEAVPASGPAAVAELGVLIEANRDRGGNLLATAAARLTADEVLSNAAVMLFGGIETNEGMTASALWYLLTEPELTARVSADRSLVAPLVEEALRLEPVAARIDRYATVDTEVAGTQIQRDDLVILSLAAANRDPASYDRPDEFDFARAGDAGHVAFAQGPHVCIAQHLARFETAAAVNAVLDGLPEIHLDKRRSRRHQGLVFRKPSAVTANWR